MTTPSFSGYLGYKTPNDTPPPHTETSQSPTISSFSPGPNSSILKTKSHPTGSTLSAKKVRFQDTGSKRKKSSDIQPRTPCATVQTCVPNETPQDSCKVDTSSPLTSTTRPLMSPPPPASTCRLNSSRSDTGSSKAQRARTAQQRRRRTKSQELDENEYEVEAILDHRKTEAYPDVEYLIKWKGYPHSDNSWVRVSNMNCWDLIQDYLRRLFRNKAMPNSIQGKHCAPSPSETKSAPQSRQLASVSQCPEKKRNLKPQSSLTVLHKRDVPCREEEVVVPGAKGKEGRPCREEEVVVPGAKGKEGRPCREEEVVVPGAKGKEGRPCREEEVVVPGAKRKEGRPNRRNRLKQRETTDRDPPCKPQPTTTKSVRSLQKEQSQRVAHKEPVSSTAPVSPFVRTSRTSTKAGTCDAHTEVSSTSNFRSESPPNSCHESQPNYHTEPTPNCCSESPLCNTNCRIDVCSPPIYSSTSTTAVVYINASPSQSSAQERTTVGSKTLAPSPVSSPLTPGFMKQQKNVSNDHNSGDNSVSQYSPPSSPVALLQESEPSSQESSIVSVSPISSFRLHLDSPSSDNGTASNDSEYTWSDSSLTWSIESIIDSPPSSPQASVVVINSSPIHVLERECLNPQLRAGNITVYPSMVPLPIRTKKAHKASTTMSVVRSSSGECNPRDSLLRRYKLAAMLHASNGHSLPLVPKQRLNGIATSPPVSLPRDHRLSSQNRTEVLPPEGKTKFVRPQSPSNHKVEAKTVWTSLLPSSTNGVKSQSSIVQRQLRRTLDTCEAAMISKFAVSRSSLSTIQETQHFAPSKQSTPEERGRDVDDAIEAWSTARLRKRSRSLSPPPLPDANSPKRKSPRFSSKSTADSMSVSPIRATYRTPQLHSQLLPYSPPPSHLPPHPQPRHHPPPHFQPHSLPHPNPPPHSQPYPHPPPHSQPHFQPSPSRPIPHLPVTVPTLVSNPRILATNNACYQEQPQPSATPPATRSNPRILATNNACYQEQPQPSATPPATRSNPRIPATNNACYQEQPQPSGTPPATRSSPRILAMHNANYQEQLLEWQYELNRQRQGTEEIIFVENCVDQAPPPRDFTYMASNIYGPSVPNPDNPDNTERLCGCTCYLMGKKCNSKARHCCPDMAGEQFPYTIAGKVRIPPGSPIFECNSKCSCPYDCANRVVQQGRMIPLCIFRTHNGRGWGVKTVEPIKANTFVTEYVGEVITSEEAERRGQQYDKKGMTYLFDLDFDDENAAFTIDAARFGNISHFFNHSCDPNLVVYSVWIETVDPRLPRIAFFTTRNISAGEELTFDYQMNHGTTNVSQSDTENGCIPCLCGSENCIGFLY